MDSRGWNVFVDRTEVGGGMAMIFRFAARPNVPTRLVGT